MEISDKFQDWIWIVGLDLDDSLLISGGICFLSTSGLWLLESLLVAGVAFADSDSAPVPEFLNSGPAIFQI